MRQLGLDEEVLEDNDETNERTQLYMATEYGISFPMEPSTRVRFCVRIAIQFRAQFAYKGFRVLIILWKPVPTACKHISGKISRKLNYEPPYAGNRITESYGNSYAELHV
jgi:hypothetical protein